MLSHLLLLIYDCKSGVRSYRKNVDGVPRGITIVTFKKQKEAECAAIVQWLHHTSSSLFFSFSSSSALRICTPYLTLKASVHIVYTLSSPSYGINRTHTFRLHT